MLIALIADSMGRSGRVHHGLIRDTVEAGR